MTGNDIPAWPVITVEISVDGSVRVDGTVLTVPPGAHPRVVALSAAAGTATSLGRAVRVQAIEPDGAIFPLAVAPDGSVVEAGAPIAPPQQRRGLLGRRKQSGPSAPEAAATSRVPQVPQAPVAAPVDRYERVDEEPMVSAPLGPEAEAEAFRPPPSAAFVEVDTSWQPPARAPEPAAPRVWPVTSPDREEPAFPASTRPDPSFPAPEEEQRRLLERIRHSLEADRGREALSMAAALDVASSRSGDRIELAAAREVHAYVAMVTGNPDLAVELYADAVSEARALAGGDDWPARMAENAHFCWLRVTDRESAFALGHAVLGAYAVTVEANSPAAGAARRHLEWIRAQMTTSP